MKRKMYFGIVLAMIACCFVACAKDNEESKQQGDIITLTSVYDGATVDLCEPTVRTYYLITVCGVKQEEIESLKSIMLE